MHMNEKGSAAGATLAVIALIVSVIALGLSWIAYNRTGEDLEQKIQEQVNQTVTPLEQGIQEGAQDLEQGVNEGAQEVEENTDEARQETSDVIEPDDSESTTNQ